MENAQIAEIFDEIADLLELKEGNEFRIRSYRNAARTVRGLSQRLEDLVEEDADLDELPNIGESTAEKIHEILDSGTCQRLEDLRKEFPDEITDLLKVPQLGPRKAMQLHEALEIDSLEDLKKACEEHRVRELEGMGPKTEENILKGLKTLSTTSGRILLKEASDHVESLGRHLESCKGLQKWVVAGSYRRGKSTVGDLDVLVHARDRKKAVEEILDGGLIAEVASRGKEKVTVRLEGGLQVDFRFFDPDSFGAALLYFTGSKAHNVVLRKRAGERDWKLNEYGLFKGEKRLAGKTEESIYHRLNLAWIPPELREDRGEVEAAEDDDLPQLVELDDIQGDLHSHTRASDGKQTIREMVDAAKDRGYKYLAITDHSKRVSMANGLDEKRLRKHAEEIRDLNRGQKGFWVLAGIEVDILKSGKLDLGEKVLADLDWVVASVHYNFNLGKQKMTDRLISAVESGVVHALGHPFARLLGKRDPLPLDADRVFEACAEHGVYIEINSQPERLDLPDTYCQRARDAGVKFVISTDAHKRDDLEFMRFGVANARRGWLTRRDVLNTSTLGTLRKRLG